MSKIAKAALSIMLFSSTIAIPALAQNMGMVGASNTSVGVLGGVNYGKAVEDPEEPGASFDYLTGWLAGGYIAYLIRQTVGVEAQALYSLKGTEVHETGGGTSGKIKAKYIEVPLLLKLRFPNTSTMTPYIFFGPVVEFNTSCTIEGSGGGITASADCENADIKLKGTSFAGAVGAGFQFPAGGAIIRFDGRYTHGLTNINDTADNTNVKLRTFSLTAGIGIPLP